MTVIAWDGQTLASDRRLSSGQLSWQGQKLFRLKDNRIVGLYGDVANFRPVIEWLENGADPKHWPKTQKEDRHACFIVVSEDQVLNYENSPHAIPIDTQYMAWGSGREVAMGALAMGATAQKSIEVACLHSVYCGDGVSFEHRG